MPPKILRGLPIRRGQLFTGIPNVVENFLIVSIDTTEHTYSLCTLQWEGGLIDNFPIQNNKLAEIFATGKNTVIDPGEDPPLQSKKKSLRTRKPPRVGDIRGNEVCTGYDFDSMNLSGRRRFRDPETGRKGYPIWNRKP